MIDVDNLTKSFGPIRAVQSVSFQVTKGEVLGFLGPNGAGKSTTMKMITGFLTPDAGAARIMGHDVLTEPQAAKSLIGYLPEGAPAYPEMEVGEFLDFIAEARRIDRAAAKQRIGQAIERTSLMSVLRQPIDTLSKGFKRRVGLAAAILADPPILIMDEPTDGLDPNQKHEVRQLINEMSGEKAIIISTHILEEVDAVCSRALIIAGGRVLADGKPSDLLEQSGETSMDEMFRKMTTQSGEAK